MILKILLVKLFGYLNVSIEGYYIERIINICKIEKIFLWNFKRVNNVKAKCSVGIKDYKKLIKIAQKTKSKIKIESKKGIPFLMNRYRKRKLFLFSILFVIIIIQIMSLYLWNIQVVVEGNDEITGIEQDVKEAGLTIGKLKNKIDTKEIINKVRVKRTDIAWLGIEVKGTNAVVKVVKAKEVPEIINPEDYCNIVATKPGIITKIIAQNGTARVAVGDTVNKGDVLIEGKMEGKYTEPRLVHSYGEVVAKVWYTDNVKIYYNQEVKEQTGNSESKYGLKINNFQINFGKKLSKFKFYDTIDTTNKLKIFSNLYLPISLEKTTFQEYENKPIKYDKEQAKELGIKELESKILRKSYG